jgi:hypothetical protein
VVQITGILKNETVTDISSSLAAVQIVAIDCSVFQHSLVIRGPKLGAPGGVLKLDFCMIVSVP